MLLVADHDFGDANLAGLVERACEQPVRLLRVPIRQQVVGLAEEHGIDLLERKRNRRCRSSA